MKVWFLLLLFFVCCNLNGQESEVWMHPNNGQWEEQILYKVDLNQGSMFIEKDGFTYALHDNSRHHNHEAEEKDANHTEDKSKYHTIKTKFKNSSWKGSFEEKDTSLFYRNYFLGQDTNQWASKVHSFQYLKLIDFYPSIDLIIETKETGVKYSFDVAPGADISKIELIHNGADSVRLVDHNIHIATRFGPIIEKELNVWTKNSKGHNKKVKAAFHVSNNQVRFDFPEGYDTTKRLIIDPELTFSSFTGGTSDNWGFTAAPDFDANLFGGGIVMGSGYPISTGAYDQTFNGGEGGSTSFDICISKFNAVGNALLYSTFIGGSGNETPNSIVSNEAGELFVLGVTSSTDFPMAGASVQTDFQGGIITTQNSLRFSGTDLILFKLNPNGTNLMASTFFGGSQNDGLNIGTLNYNYGDQFRGEIIVKNNYVYIASSTQSTDFPTLNGWKNNLSGDQDAILAKFTDDFSTVLWSTYFGGDNLETGNAVQISSTGNVFMTGGTTSNNLNLPDGSYISNYQGGLADGYIVEFNTNTCTPVNGTYIGTDGYDQTYFVQLDLDDNVYVFGQTNGDMPISDGVYNNPNSGQFIQKYDPILSNVEWVTRVGGGNNTIEISPTAFLVSDCGEIYYAGWGGENNRQFSQSTGSTTSGFPVTDDAFQQTTNGDNFYVAVLNSDVTALNYASYIGVTGTNHVDGGTSRFDKKGRIYHAVCGACGGDTYGFTTTPGVVSTTNNSNNCNMAVFKFDLGAIRSSVSLPESVVCIPDPVQFQNNSQNALEFFWDFGDGNTSTEFAPEHYYTEPGVYTVTLFASDSSICLNADSSTVEITVGSYENAATEPPTPICPDTSYELEATGGETYAWSPAAYLDDSTSATPTATISEDTEFIVVISNVCNTVTLPVMLEVYDVDSEIIEDQEVCIKDTLDLWVSEGQEYEWSPVDYIVGSNTQSEITVSPLSSVSYTVNVITNEGCEFTEDVFIEVFQDMPDPILDDSIGLCLGDAITINAGGGQSYEWFPNQYLDVNLGPTVTTTPLEDITYVVDFTNPCGTVSDSIFVEAIVIYPTAGYDTIICPGETTLLWAEGGVGYEWSPTNSVTSPSSASTIAHPENPTVYEVLVTGEYGCFATTSVTVDFYPLPNVIVQTDYYAFKDDEVEITANGSNPEGSYTWEPEAFLSCSDCQSPIASPPQTTIFNVLYTDGNGCKTQGETTINLDGILYVPNTFTPDGNGFNDSFFPKGGNLKEYHMVIFNRWGELVFESYDLSGKWDGTYGNEKCKDGTYTWKITYTDLSNNKKEIVGHVNLLR